MLRLYNINDITPGKPTKSGHEAYLDAVYNPPEGKGTPLKVIFKKNKKGDYRLSRLEVAFSQLAYLFLAKDTTSCLRLVVNNAGVVVGSLVQHLCYVIAKKEGINKLFYTLKNPKTNCDVQSIQIHKAEEIPFYFLNKLPQGFFNDLLKAEKQQLLSIDYASLASIFASSYTLEEDDLHKGNFGFYLVEHEGKPRVIFFKIDHDLMFVDSIMSFATSRPFHLMHDSSAFDITEEDLSHFPNLKHSANSYWPTKLSHLSNPWDNKEFHDEQEVDSFADLRKVPQFQRAKWMSFFKHILISQEMLEHSLMHCFNKHDPIDQSEMAVVIHATLARQARLRAMLFSIKEFRQFVLSLSIKERQELLEELVSSSSLDDKKKFLAQLTDDLTQYNIMCVPDNGFIDGDTPLHIAIKLGDYRYEETIQMYGHLINKKNKLGQTPLDVAVHMISAQKNKPFDVRKDLRFTMQHLLECGARPTKKFKVLNLNETIERYHAHNIYHDRASKASSYLQLKAVLKDIGEDHSFCLKFKKKLAIACITKFINANQKHAYCSAVLVKLKEAINGQLSKTECADLKYIRQLRSRLWIVRQIRGLFGWTTTLGEINHLIGEKLEQLGDKKANWTSFFPCSQFIETELVEHILPTPTVKT